MALIVNFYCPWVSLFIHISGLYKINKIRSFTGQGIGAWAEQLGVIRFQNEIPWLFGWK